MVWSEDRRKICDPRNRNEKRKREPSKHEALHIHSPPRPMGNEMEGHTQREYQSLVQVSRKVKETTFLIGYVGTAEDINPKSHRSC